MRGEGRHRVRAEDEHVEGRELDLKPTAQAYNAQGVGNVGKVGTVMWVRLVRR